MIELTSRKQDQAGFSLDLSGRGGVRWTRRTQPELNPRTLLPLFRGSQSHACPSGPERRRRGMIARASAKRVAPGSKHKIYDPAPKGRNIFRPFRPQRPFDERNQGRRARFASHLPLAVIFRAFGALLLRQAGLLHYFQEAWISAERVHEGIDFHEPDELFVIVDRLI